MQYRDVSAEVREVAKAMREVGMPHLLEAQDRTRETFTKGLAEAKSELHGAVSTMSDRIGEEIRTLKLVFLGGFAVLAGLAIGSIIATLSS